MEVVLGTVRALFYILFFEPLTEDICLLAGSQVYQDVARKTLTKDFGGGVSFLS